MKFFFAFIAIMLVISACKFKHPTGETEKADFEWPPVYFKFNKLKQVVGEEKGKERDGLAVKIVYDSEFSAREVHINNLAKDDKPIEVVKVYWRKMQVENVDESVLMNEPRANWGNYSDDYTELIEATENYEDWWDNRDGKVYGFEIYHWEKYEEGKHHHRVNISVRITQNGKSTILEGGSTEKTNGENKFTENDWNKLTKEDDKTDTKLTKQPSE